MKSLLGEKQLNGKTPEKQNMAVYDVLLLNKAANGVWDRVTDENFPAAGVTVTIPYPEGTNVGLMVSQKQIKKPGNQMIY